MMAPPDKGGIEYNVTAPRTQGKDNRFWIGFPFASFLFEEAAVVKKYLSLNIPVTGYCRK
jgi:hypothetical protein